MKNSYTVEEVRALVEGYFWRSTEELERELQASGFEVLESSDESIVIEDADENNYELKLIVTNSTVAVQSVIGTTSEEGCAEEAEEEPVEKKVKVKRFKFGPSTVGAVRRVIARELKVKSECITLLESGNTLGTYAELNGVRYPVWEVLFECEILCGKKIVTEAVAEVIVYDTEKVNVPWISYKHTSILPKEM